MQNFFGHSSGITKFCRENFASRLQFDLVLPKIYILVFVDDS